MRLLRVSGLLQNLLGRRRAKLVVGLIVALVLAAVIGFAGGYLVNEMRGRRRRAGAR